MAMNGEADYITREEFTKHVSANDSAIGNLEEEQGVVHGMLGNFLQEQAKRDKEYREQLFYELAKLRAELTGEVRKTQDSFHELEEVTSKTKIESLRVRLAEEKESRRELKRWIRIAAQVLASAAGGGTFWELVRNAILHK